MLWGALIGALMGLQNRANDQMRANGIRPSWSQRHQILAFLIGMLVFFVGVVVWINLAVAWTRPVLFTTVVVVVLLVVRGSIAAYVRAERRWR